MSLPEIIEYTDRLEKQAKALMKNALRLSWHMRGAVNLDETYALSSEQMEAINEIIQENFEFTKETKIPFI
jgi:hypothetical protein